MKDPEYLLAKANLLKKDSTLQETQILKDEYFWTIHNIFEDYHEGLNFDQRLAFIKEMEPYLPDSFLGAIALARNLKKVLSLYKADRFFLTKQKSDLLYLVNTFKKLNIPKSESSFSDIMRQLSRLQDNQSDWYLPLIKEIGLEGFEEKDYQRIKRDGNLIISLYELIMLNTAKHIEKSDSLVDMQWFLPFLENALCKFPGIIWFKYYKARLLLKVGRVEEAKPLLKDVLMKQNDQFWAWELYGSLYTETNPRLYFSFLCKAALKGKEESALPTLRLNLAKEFITRKMHAEAKTELEQIMKTGEQEGWEISNEITRLNNLKEISSAVAQTNNIKAYEVYQHTADEHLALFLETKVGIVTSILPDKKIAFLVFGQKLSAALKMKEKNEVANGDILKISIAETNIRGEIKHNVINYERTDEKPSSDFYKIVTGTLNLKKNKKGNPYAFVQDVHIRKDIIVPSGIREGEKISLVCFKFYKKNGESKWRAIKALQ